MAEKVQSPKEKETEDIKGRHRRSSLRSVGIAALCIPVLIVGPAYTGHKSKKMRPEENQIVNTYNEAKKTLSNLNYSKLQVSEENNQPYIPGNLDEELKYIFMPQKRQDLERAVQIVENDIQTMEDTSDALRNYNEATDKADQFEEKGILYTIMSALGIWGVGVLNVIRGNKAKKKKLEKIEEKYKGCQFQ